MTEFLQTQRDFQQIISCFSPNAHSQQGKKTSWTELILLNLLLSPGADHHHDNAANQIARTSRYSLLPIIPHLEEITTEPSPNLHPLLLPIFSTRMP
jgi:hypothetical protein